MNSRRKRAIVIVLDGFGIGEMPDVSKVRPEDVGVHTAKHIAERVGGLHLPNLEAMGLGNIAENVKGLRPVRNPSASYGRCMLKHFGADTYAGHQEIMGTNPREPVRQLFIDVMDEVEAALLRAGHKTSHPLNNKPLLLVDDCVTIADNIEADPGININVTAPLDYISFDEASAIGEVVRSVVKVARVIVFGSTGYGPEDILHRVEARPSGQLGVNSPALGAYNQNYRVRHMGYGVVVNKQTPTILVKHHYEVSLIGKVADVIRCEGAQYLPAVQTSDVLDITENSIERIHSGLIAANVQETDLAGHEEDPIRFAHVLTMVDERLPQIVDRLEDHDLLVLTADHGNDPTDGKRKHTREMTPLLAYGKKLKRVSLGTRTTMADTAATISEMFAVEPPESGISYYSALTRWESHS